MAAWSRTVSASAAHGLVAPALVGTSRIDRSATHPSAAPATAPHAANSNPPRHDPLPDSSAMPPSPTAYPSEEEARNRPIAQPRVEDSACWKISARPGV